MKQFLIIALVTLAVLYLLLCALLFFMQEGLIFYPERLSKDHVFAFGQNHEEIFIKAEDNVVLHGLLFRGDSSRGVVFYLHGNAGSLDSWGGVAGTYISLGHDLFIIDYRGYGKSDGEISRQEQLFNDVQTAYVELLTRYPENEVVVLGYSIGSGPAAKLAADNQPKMLILQAPFYNFSDVMRENFSFIPTFLLKYKFQTDKYLKRCDMPVIIFHGDRDEVIPYESSLKLQELFKPTDTLITLHGQGHNGMTESAEYMAALREILAEL